MKKHKMRGTGELPLDMTPMIDVVFNLIIFFMIVIDLSQKELENIILPRASECQPDENPEDKRKIINVVPQGDIIVKRRTMDLDQLQTDLAIWRSKVPEEDGGFCSKPILIRTDRGTEMKHVQKIMEVCGKEQLKIYQIELACSEDSPGFHPNEIPGQVVHGEEE
jgi:biopolymer transport protein ExbD